MPNASSPTRSLRLCADAACAWLFEKAMPLWLSQGIDQRHGGFHEALEPDATPSPIGFKRLRVAARQVYVCVEGARHGVTGAREAVGHGLDFMLTKFRHPQGGFASRCAVDGRIADPTRDLYDLAFVLFALAHAYRLTSAPALRREALDLLAHIKVEMAHPAGGYHESLPPRLPRRQNPHMHLLEACLACHAHMQDLQFSIACDELADLFEQRFLERATGTLGEYYADNWQPHSPDGRTITEPGHHLEWAWLLTEMERLCGRQVQGAGKLASFALRHGLDPASGLLRGALFSNGDTANPSVRIWAHCEWLKAALALQGEAGDPVIAWQALARFLDRPQPGLWFERWDQASGVFIAGAAPASSLYHITAAVVALREHAA